MKMFNCSTLEPRFRGFWGSLLGLALLSTPLAAQVILNPVTIQGTVGFTNTNPTILGWLTNALSPVQTSEVVIYADSQPPAASVQTEWSVVTNTARVAYEMTVDAVTGGVVYSVSPDWFLAPNSSDRYYFAPRNTPSLVPGAHAVTMDFAEAAGVLELHFVNSTGGPVAIQGLKVQAYPLGSTTLAADSGTDGGGVPAGTSITTKDLLVPGGGSYWAVVTCQTGSNYYTDTVAYTVYLTNTVPRDEIVITNVVIPSGSQLARITGNVNLVGEFALTVPSWPLGSSNAEYPGYTLVEAYSGPFNNQRWAAVTGTDFSVSASGPFVLTNLVAQDPANPQYGYLVQAQIAVRTNRDYAFFESPALGYGPNPQLVLSPGTNANLGNLFVITPGYVDAPILLQGPPETPTQPSALRYLDFGADTKDPYGYGLPEGAILYGIIDTYAYMKGSSQVAPGATWAASAGESCSAGTGAFNAASASYEGQVNLPLGGLASQPSLWQRGGLNYVISETTNGPQNYLDTVGYIYCQDTNTHLITAGVTNSGQVNFNFAFSQVSLSIVSPTTQFRNPYIFETEGTFSGTNFQGRLDNYQTLLVWAYGTPTSSFTNQGLIVMYLPQGTYSLAPTVTSLNPDGSTSLTTLEPVNLVVGVSQQIYLESGLQVQLNAPTCANTPTVPISGQVLGSNAIASVTLSINGGSPTTLCTGCGMSPTFTNSVAVSATECSNTTVTVTAKDILGETASTTSAIRFNNVVPVIHCPTNIFVSCAGSGGAVVTFSPTATASCSGAVNVVCTPPSGSTFGVGTTPVLCVATDSCGNTNTCTFDVIVTGSELAIRLAIEITWTCGGLLQSAPSVTGPWTTVTNATSPYYTVPTAQQAYFRVQN